MTDGTPQPVDAKFTFQPAAVLTTIAFAALFALGGYAGDPMAAALVFAGGVVAWGWPTALGLPTPRGTTAVIGFCVVATVVAAALPMTDPLLRWLPVALALSLLAAFVHQLARRDGRPRLVESVSSTVLGIGVVGCGACYFPLTRVLHGETVIAMGMAAIALAATVDLLGRWPAWRPWTLPIGALLGAGAALVVAGTEMSIQWPAAVLVGFATAVVSWSFRRVVAALPAAPSPKAQLVSGTGSLLVCGVLVYVAGRVLVA